MVKAKIKFILPLVVWLCSLFPNLIIGQRLKLSSQLSKHKEIFFRNLEEGVFGCQLNESQNFLQIFNLSQLCDGVPDCYAQSDENQELVECTDDCFDLKTGKRGCQNGICIKGQCHCNNGFSGCNCDIEDENECLNRPCDVFAHCTNLVGSYKCTCFPGYEGDGSHCKDIDECLDPEINSRCKANSKCCNIPGHYLCKCNEGFRGNGEEHCEDIDECKERINICGKYATCTNTFGNYSCDCDNGYRINALKQCERINDECGEAGICGYGAICKDTKRGKKCECKPGYKLDSNNNCIDTTNECDSSICSRNEICINTDTGSKCSCLPGFVRNIFLNECQDINECIDNPCGENTECINILGSYKCICEEGYQQLSNKKDSCIRRDVNILCNSNNECTTNALCKDNQCVCDNGFVAKGSECIDIDECQSKYQICGQNATCLNIVGSYHCHCIDGYIGSPPDTACMKPCDSIQCGPHSYCNATSATEVYCICDDGWTFNPSRISDGCIDIDECIESKHKCSSGAICINTLGSYICRCRDGFEGNPYKGSCVSKHKQCFTDSSCASNEQCILDENGGKCECLAPFYRDGNQCLNPCQRYQCGMHASCSIGDPVNCACDPGFTGNPYTGCVDIDECKNQPCAYGADCINLKGRFECICPKGTLGDPYNNECVIQTTGKYKTECYTHEDCSSYQICKDNSCINSCNLLKCDKNSHCETDKHNAYCKCLDGYKVGPKGTCVSVCDDFKCASGATCIAAEYGPTCQCQDGLRGNPFAGGNCVRDKCSVNNPCPIPLICTDGRCKESCNDLMCGIGASCNQTINQCVCYNNFIGDPMHLCMPPAYPPICDGNCEGNSYCEYGPTGARCKTLSLECPNGCSHGETCVSGHCENKCHNIICGVNAICQLDDNNNPRCYCPPEYSRGNPLVKCSSGKSDEDIETDCRNSGCGRNAQCINMGTFYECQCNADTYGNPNVECNAANEVSCKVNEDCLVEEACINSHCIDSCKIRDTCGKNAICTTKQHRPHCSCPQCYFGMPNIECIFDSKCSSLIPRNQCVQKKCEGNQKCLVKNNQEVCVCAFGYFVNKQGELVCSSKKIQCQNSFDCPLNKACIDGQCENPCQNFECPINKTCHVFNRTPICKCNEDCIASVSICRTDRGCPSHLACRNYRCVNPCTIHNCSNDRDQFCFVRNHQAVCDQCDSGFIKDSQFGCLRANGSKSYCKSIEDCNVQSEICIKNQCIKVCTLQCGSNAQCISKPYQSPKCECFKGFYKKHNSDTCVPMEIKCLKNSDCSTHLECFNGHCENPCSTRNICANNEKCQVYDHEIICIKDVEKKEQVKDCGYCEYGYECDERTGQCVKVICDNDNDCADTETCYLSNCKNPCELDNVCGENAQCQSKAHRPMCTCFEGYKGNPSVQCVRIGPSTCTINSDCNDNENSCINGLCQNPCVVNNPCSLYADCFVAGNGSRCVCKNGYEGDGYNCLKINKEAVCHYNIDCLPTEYCDRLNRICVNPCNEEECGQNAECIAEDHKSSCKCLSGYSGDPYQSCSEENFIETSKSPYDQSPCGTNALYSTRNGAGSCVCPNGYIGDPYVKCQLECGIDNDCHLTKACVNGKCKNPCIGQCGINAQCLVRDHKFHCFCDAGYEGNPFEVCQPMRPIEEKKENYNPCLPSPCGPNSACKVIKDRAVCSCLPNFLGTAPNCRHECTNDLNCPSNKACINYKCANPCLNACGVNALCHVNDHKPVCSCSNGFIGDPFVNCILEEKDPCLSSPCGPNAECKTVNGRPACSCLKNYKGRPPNCYPECITNDDCPFNMACENNNCFNPCSREPCGLNAECSIIQHKRTCLCYNGFDGDAEVECTEKKFITEIAKTPCDPSPCGINALCRERNSIGSCSCIENYFGNPYVKCQPECVIDTECLKSKACFQNKCVDPCSGACGNGALCQTIDHRPLCSCPEGTSGDPLSFCKNILQEKKVLNKIDPCMPSPCGPNSQCRSYGDQAVCSCLPKYIGSPPKCHPECSKNSDCDLMKACVNYKCMDPCPGTCGLNAECRVITHSPICSCKPGFNGDPFTKCFPIIVEKDHETNRKNKNPCLLNPCGANSKCTEKDGFPICSCLKGYLGRPPDCRPECTVHSDCRQNQACIKQKCQDPCVAVCGINAECSVVNHVPVCKCIDGFKGDSFVSCQKVIEPEKPIAKDKCNPSPCGNNADCKDGICTCILDYKGDPYRECRPECIVNSDCDQNKACIKNKCKDPCDDTCGLNAFCETFNHIPMCSCINGYSGDPFFKCDKTAVLKQSSPCSPSPCGPNSQCREQDDRAICSCLSEYNGAPPNCRPECVHNSECSLDKSCVNLKCIDTCLGACGFNAQCRMVNHNPICSCPTSFTGDPFVQCQKLAEHRVVIEKINPCIPSPCGPNSICEAIGEKAACACKENYKGSPPNCKPECVSNNDCSSSMGCINFKCMNPCSDLCGLNTTCFVRNHNPNCICLEGYEGDPFVECSPKFQEIATELLNPCEPNPCGENALCRVQNNAGSCTCMESYLGNPYVRCKPECVVNSDCPLNKDCINNKCKDPCPGTCAINAMCQTVNHIPFCTCHDSYTGDAFKYCYPIVESSDRKNIDPCSPSPCGPYSQCKNANEQAVCSCLPEYLGSPPYCRPECTSNSECALEKSCINRKCVDPCSGTCGQNADCRVIDHSPVCSCRPKYSGDPFVKCWPIKIDIISKEISHPCIPNPCGPNSKCLERNQHASCTCLDGYKGVAPYCRSECTINSDCPKDLACMNLKCRDPCPGACGINAKCSVVNHVANCECLAGYEGNSFLSCKKKIERNQEKQDKCNPNPCGENAKCSDGVCTCILDYRGNPYERCRPECLVNLDCANNKACIQTKCQNPCEEACGQNADCNVINHIAVCSCRDGYDGNPFKNCKLMSKTIDNIQPCHPSPCGPNSQCREANGLAVCSCLPNYVGNPPACRPECIYSSDCNLEKTCRNYKCIDPCPGTCGVEAECRAINHNPICTCPSGLIGDPFVRCQRIRQEIENLSRPKDPCNPSPCGLNSKCQVIDGRSVCSCLANFIGSPPYCKRECVSHDECSNHMACINYKCSDPCKDSCGIQAECYVRNHVANCVCSPKYTGDPNIRCTIIVEHEKTIERRDPCEPSPCGINAKCLIENQGYSCQCIDEYQGDPYLICRPECTSNSDCSYDKACVNMKCADPCKETCGKNAQCTVTNHIPNCYCPEDTSGNAFIQCTPISKLEKQNPCIPSPCGLNAECHIRGEFAVCECLAGFFIGDDGVNCKTECTVSSDCPTHKSCSNQQCVDPCDGVCGFGAICNVVNHNPICRCPENTRGDPFKSCIRDIDTPKDSCSSSPCGNNGICNEHNGLVRCTYPECVTNSDCPQTKVCSNLKCHDPCARACGVNALCQVTNHKAYCYCPDNYVGSPKMQCFPKSNIEITQVECNSDSDCGNDKTCINTKCINPCDEYKYSCGENAKCYAQMHRALCICPDGYSGNAQVACIKVECESSYDCPSNKFCRNNNCVDPCKYVECGQNAQCKVNRNRQAECYCPNSYIGNPLDYCKLPECSVNSDCSKNLACKNNKCVNPCECGINAECFVQNHIAVCTCLSGYSGIPEIACDVRQKTNAKGCRSDSECASKLACINNECQNPCIKNSPCGLNAKCVVVDSLPSRTMSCICEPGLIGDAYVKCNLGHYHAVCNSDFDCSDNEVCLNRECKDVCSLQICAFNADCHGKNHKAFCKCRPGFLGDSLRFCSPTTKLPIPICLRDSDCPSNKICINKDCKDLCKMGSYCGKNTQCEIKDHRPICKCLNGFTGNPSEACYKVECNSDDNCPYDKKCRNNKCVNPCENLKEKCGRNAKCTVTNHVEQCVCPQGTQGNPYLSCVAVECTFSEDCAEDEYCERQNGICKKVCDVDTCTESAECFGKNHLAICECSSGMMIDSYGECKHVEQNECSSDSECGKNLVCTHHKCINPCLLDYICTGNQQCIVTETYPLKTTICKCPDDTVYENGLCKKIPRIDVECTENNQCKDSHKCINNFCIDACKADLCGINSICKASNHQANCYCDRNYAGDPHIECLFNGYELPRPKECSNNKDCPYDKLCLNKICVNPCSLDDQCANNALCRVEHHEVHCSCPPGFKGDPKIQCNVDKTAIKVVECTSHTKCPKDKACIDNVCVNPCNCEPNSICKVINHYPICYCKEGYINNPIIGCVKAECRAKDDCADDELCHNNKCVSVCLLAYPCKYPYSMCYGRNHEAKCKCQEGYDESTNGVCIRRECASDNDCTNDKTCRNHKCINPCIDLDENRCAFNAHCHVQYHKALCYCPPHLPVGNPQENCFAKELIENKPECQSDSDCPSKLACIRDQCIQPCEELSPCQSSTKCDVMDTMPIRTLVCTCPDGWISKEDGECTEISLKVIGECVTDENCDQNSACINRICRNPCNCGSNAECYVKNHRAICSCKNGYIGHPQIGCSKVECTKNFDCDQNKACIQNNCIDPCMIKNPCGHNAECYVDRNHETQCRCFRNYYGDPYDKCISKECQSSNECSDDKKCINYHCIDPCVHENQCSSRAKCIVRNHNALCQCPLGYSGDPLIECRFELQSECKIDEDCPSRLACLNGKCQDICAVNEPCSGVAHCSVLDTLPVRTAICVCPDGYVSDGKGSCKITEIIKLLGDCSTDSDCSPDKACMNNICRNPCNCGTNAHCTVHNHRPICSCLENYDGNPEIHCHKGYCSSDNDCTRDHFCQNYKCFPVCSSDKQICGNNAECYSHDHKAVCKCRPGFYGDAKSLCLPKECTYDSDCPSTKSCYNQKCVDSCTLQDEYCPSSTICKVSNHKAICVCAEGLIENEYGQCSTVKIECRSDSDCPSQKTCINSLCINPCNETSPCGDNSKCKVLDTNLVKTIICECISGYEGNALEHCKPEPLCDYSRGLIVDDFGNCICPPGKAFNKINQCVYCFTEVGYEINENNHCVCALEKGFISIEDKECVCPYELNYRIDEKGNCSRVIEIECESNQNCPETKQCVNNVCINPCEYKQCVENAICRVRNHEPNCDCIPGFKGNGEDFCKQIPPSRTSSPPEVVVNCLSDGIQVKIHIVEDEDFNSIFYVKKYSSDERCRKLIDIKSPITNRTEIFKVKFGTCGLVHVNGEAHFILVMQKHPTLVTYKAQAYHIKCIYKPSEQNVTLGFNVSMLTTAGTIANTGPPPTCILRIVTKEGDEINSAEIGEDLALEVEVQPSSIYGGLARNCIAKTTEDNNENEYLVTDENGCAVDTTIFNDWEYNRDRRTLRAIFHAFKFPNSDNIRFQCNIRICFGQCQPINCHGRNAFGRKRRQIDEDFSQSDKSLIPSGLLKEEIIVQSNPILTFEKQDENLFDRSETTDAQRADDDICVSIWGFIISLILTALLSIVAVAIAVSCWLMAHRRRHVTPGPLPHPPEFPNPLFTSPNPMMEPSPDYLR